MKLSLGFGFKKDQRGIKCNLYLRMNTIDFILKNKQLLFVSCYHSVSSTHPLKTGSVFKLGDSPEPYSREAMKLISKEDKKSTERETGEKQHPRKNRAHSFLQDNRIFYSARKTRKF